MNIEWLHKSDSSRLIIIFSGWSTDASFYSHICHEGWDVAVVSGYSDMDFPKDLITSYSTIALFAWSMGIYVASVVMSDIDVALAVAVNGTEFPANDNYGIPLHIFDATAETLSEQNLKKFRRRMTGKKHDDISSALNACNSDIDTLRRELQFIRSHSSLHCTSPFRWDRVYVSSEDRIFPFDAQMKAWKNHSSSPDIVILEEPHFVDLLPIIKGVLPSYKKIGERFRKAINTYDRQASAQRVIARKLTQLCPSGSYNHILEIGSGTGIFTHMIAEKCNPEKMTFVDLYELPKYNAVTEEKYIIADAETWLEEESKNDPASVEAIVSASAIQWFADPRRFFHNASRLLKSGGMLLCSTFLPGNLDELKDVSPYGLVYRRKEELKKYLEMYFNNVYLEDMSLPIAFSTTRDTLLHLRHTGVGGGSSSEKPLGELLSNLPPHLTYKSLFIRAYN